MTDKPNSIGAIGIDMGSTTVKLVAIDASGRLIDQRIENTEPQLEEQAKRMLDDACAEKGDIPIVATGYGRKLVRNVHRVVTEISCHAKGVYKTLDLAGTLIDIGGQDSKVIVLGEKGRVLNFAMNDKCAAGTGRFLEVTAARLKLKIEMMGQMALDTNQAESISSTCTVFAESEIISLIARGKPIEHIVRGLHKALISRVASLVKSVQPKPPMMLSGGVAQNPAVRSMLSEELGQEITVPEQPQLMGALGAALHAI